MTEPLRIVQDGVYAAPDPALDDREWALYLAVRLAVSASMRVDVTTLPSGKLVRATAAGCDADARGRLYPEAGAAVVGSLTSKGDWSEHCQALAAQLVAQLDVQRAITRDRELEWRAAVWVLSSNMAFRPLKGVGPT